MSIKIGIVFNQGIGDALLLMPLIKKIRQQYPVTLHAIFQSEYCQPGLIEHFELFDEYIVLQNSIKQTLNFTFKRIREFDLLILNHTSASFIWLCLAPIIARKTVTNRSHKLLRLIPLVTYIQPRAHTHEILNNLGLVFTNIEGSELSLQKLLLPTPSPLPLSIKIEEKLPSSFFTVQISAGNNIVKYKNWPVENWIHLIRLIRKAYPQIMFILLGEPRESGLAKEIGRQNIEGVVSMVGQTNINEAIAIIERSELYIGLDSGLMHLAAMAGKPTFTIWGPTSPKVYGYEQFNAQRHRDLCTYEECHPCLSWPTSNQSRVTHPGRCPDRRCITKISPLQTFEAFCIFWKDYQKYTLNGQDGH